MKITIGILLYLVSLLAFSGPLKMSAEYLSGEWCFVSSEYGGKENLNFTFNPDGSLLYQNSRYSSRNDRKGSYKIAGDELKIEPTLAAFTLKVKSIEESAFVLKGAGDHIFEKGRCK